VYNTYIHYIDFVHRRCRFSDSVDTEFKDGGFRLFGQVGAGPAAGCAAQREEPPAIADEELQAQNASGSALQAASVGLVLGPLAVLLD
jgi:hypothetical protein